MSTIIGPPESGKTWFAYAAAVEVLAAGGSVVWIDLEDFEAVAEERLLHLGATESAIREKFTYIRPQRPLDEDQVGALVKLIEERGVVLVVVDSMSEVIGLSGNLTSDLDIHVVKVHRRLRPLAETGAAVVLIDHTPKNNQGTVRGRRGPVGSHRKEGGLDGAGFELEGVAEFGRGLIGRARVYLFRDRPGHLRRVQNPSRVIAEFQLASEQTGSNPDTFEATPALLVPDEHTGDDQEQLKQRISHILEAHLPKSLNSGELHAALGPVEHRSYKSARDSLEAGGFIKQVKRKGSNAKYYLHVARFPDEDT